jgi:hypothetical protein
MLFLSIMLPPLEQAYASEVLPEAAYTPPISMPESVEPPVDFGDPVVITAEEMATEPVATTEEAETTDEVQLPEVVSEQASSSSGSDDSLSPEKPVDDPNGELETVLDGEVTDPTPEVPATEEVGQEEVAPEIVDEAGTSEENSNEVEKYISMTVIVFNFQPRSA